MYTIIHKIGIYSDRSIFYLRIKKEKETFFTKGLTRHSRTHDKTRIFGQCDRHSQSLYRTTQALKFLVSRIHSGSYVKYVRQIRILFNPLFTISYSALFFNFPFFFATFFCTYSLSLEVD